MCLDTCSTALESYFFQICVTFSLLLPFVSRHFKQYSSIFLILIPELMFMLCLFGYLVFMVIFKWVMYTSADSNKAPSILIHFIDMFLFAENKENALLYEGQVGMRMFLTLKEEIRCQSVYSPVVWNHRAMSVSLSPKLQSVLKGVIWCESIHRSVVRSHQVLSVGYIQCRLISKSTSTLTKWATVTHVQFDSPMPHSVNVSLDMHLSDGKVVPSSSLSADDCAEGSGGGGSLLCSCAAPGEAYSWVSSA